MEYGAQVVNAGYLGVADEENKPAKVPRDEAALGSPRPAPARGRNSAECGRLGA
jgi:hypothetical protein